ncbi:MAG: hypothetical protein QFF03_18915 [Pseudomonadota bacterium]|nr:hypothetical protein [Pseudomonadota bacterium]
MGGSKAKRREGSPRRRRRDAAHGTEKNKEADFRRNVRILVKKLAPA